MTVVDLNALFKCQDTLPYEEQGLPLLWSDGKPAVLEPAVLEAAGTPPGCWIRFKAALVNVPLLGRIESVQLAAREMQAWRPALEALRKAADFRKQVHAQLHTQFGSEIAATAIRDTSLWTLRGNAPLGMTLPQQQQEFYGRVHRMTPPPAQLLTTNQMTRTIQEARRLADLNVQHNDEAIGTALSAEKPPLRDHERTFVKLCAIAELQDRYYRRRLAPAQIAAATAGARKLLSELRDAGIDPEGVFAPSTPEKYRDRISASRADQIATVAAQYRDCCRSLADLALNRRKVERLRPGASTPGEAGSSSRRAPAPSHEIDIVLALCANATADARFSDEVVTQAWQDLEWVRGQLAKELPGRTEEERTAVLRRVAEGREASLAGRPKLKRDGGPPAGGGDPPRKRGNDNLLDLARSAAIVEELKREFDPENADSTLYQIVTEAIKDHPQAASLNFTQMMGRFMQQMLEDINSRTLTLHEKLGCEDNLRVVIAQARRKLLEHTSKAVRDHLAALDQVRASATLTPGQKKLLLEYAEPASEELKPHRLDPVMVEECQRVADTLAAALPHIQAGIREDSSHVMFDEMSRVARACVHAMMAIQQNAETMWVLLSYNQLGAEEEILRLCARLALARLQDAGQSVDGAPLAPAGSVANQFLEACQQSPLRSVNKIGALYGDPVLSICAGPRIPEPEEQLSLRSTHEPLYTIGPELLVRTLIEPYEELRDDPDWRATDHRGVVPDAPNAHRVKEDFEVPARWWEHDAPEADLQYGMAYLELGPPPQAGSESSLRDVRQGLSMLRPGSRFILDGKRHPSSSAQGSLAGVPDTAEIFRNLLQQEPGGPELTRAIIACMNENVLRSFRTEVDAAAFDHPPIADLSPDIHEVWRDPDGDWHVRSSCVSHPVKLGSESLNTEGVILYTLEHVITLSSGEARATIHLLDADVVFDF